MNRNSAAAPGRALVGNVQHADHVDVRQGRKFVERLLHEDSSAVDRRLDRVGRDKQDAEAFGRSRAQLQSDRGSTLLAAGEMPPDR